MNDMAWTTRQNDTFLPSARLLVSQLPHSLVHQFSIFNHFQYVFMRRRDRLTEPFVFSHLSEEFSSGLFLRFPPFDIRLGFVTSDGGRWLVRSPL